MRVCEWFCISSRKLTSRCTGTLQVGRLSCKGYLPPLRFAVRPLRFSLQESNSPLLLSDWYCREVIYIQP